jgi:hypothetical protein
LPHQTADGRNSWPKTPARPSGEVGEKIEQGFSITWKDGAYRVSVPNLLGESERLEVVPRSYLEQVALALSDAYARIGELEGERNAASWPGVIEGWRSRAETAEAALVETRAALEDAETYY